ncbi:hypothetical protein EXIGLDRAFT_770221 [Exidia glandulosa HHB12029]|uniref:Uncharacterized protein n=1 Tax=Exidia glandulosa HHB12029 TaxID=1314781 RepID=A0A165GV49_EXIGL|nr:hypothetical protein EXIGLDRAFT_770221 [Exidia glandulosa HHB12029]
MNNALLSFANGDCSSLCCNSVQPHNACRTPWEPEIAAFLSWLMHNGGTKSEPFTDLMQCSFCIRITTKIDWGRVCGVVEYGFFPGGGSDGNNFKLVLASSRIESGLTYLCAFKNFKCEQHRLYFMIDIFKRGA